MSADLKKSSSNGREISLTPEEQQQKINEVRNLIGPLSGKLSRYCTDAAISRYLRARNWNIKKATKMLRESLQWRLKYKPEEIRWDEIAHEAETGKIYRSNYKDKHGRTVLVMRPRCQNSKSTKGQIRYLVYCMENAILNLPKEQEQLVWLIDFHGFNMSHISIKVTRETAVVLQEHYPERLGIAILYNAPKFFEPFWKLAKPFLEPKTVNKVKFCYSSDPNTKTMMEDMFDLELIESAFGGKDDADFDVIKYAGRMREDDEKMSTFWMNVNDPATDSVPDSISKKPSISEPDSEISEGKVVVDSSSHSTSLEEIHKVVEELPVQKVEEEEKSPEKLPGISVLNE